MARKSVGKPAGDVYYFVPDGPDEKNKEDATPVTVHIKAPTQRIRRQILAAAAKDEITGIEVCIEKTVTKVENYKDSRGCDVVTASDLIEHGEDWLCWSVFAEVLESSSLDEETKKALEQSRVST